MNLNDMLASTATKYPDNIACALGNHKLTYAEVERESNRIAHALLGLGLKPGDRVALLLSNTPDFPIIYFGITKTGAAAVPLDTRYTIEELTSIFGSCQPRMLIADSPCLEALVPELPRFKSIEHVIEKGDEFSGSFLSYPGFAAGAPSDAVGGAVSPGATAHITYTSGSTTHPTGVMDSHRALLVDAAGAVDAAGFRSDDTFVMFALPLYHAFALVIATICAYYAGSNVVMVSGLSIEAALATIEKHRATVFMGVPYIYALANQFAEKEGVKHDISSLRVIFCGGSAMPPGIATRFKQFYGKDLQQIWGLTEGMGHITIQPLESYHKIGSCGKPFRGWELRIVDDRGNELSPEMAGEIMVRGPLMDGYFNNPEATAAVMKDGWLDTGDIGKLDRDGELYMLARKKEIIIPKGQNICNIDIEEVLRSHPDVADAVAIAVHDDIRSERVRAVVSLKEGGTATERDLKEHCRKHMALFKVPREIIIMPGLRMSVTGDARVTARC